MTTPTPAAPAPESMPLPEHLDGRLFCAGNLTLLEDGEQAPFTGVAVSCSKDALRNLKHNLVYSAVSIYPNGALERELAAALDEKARAEARVKECKINTNVRLFDLVRHMRLELHRENLITDDEYSWLCSEAGMSKDTKGGSPSPRRLEDYDALRAQLAAYQNGEVTEELLRRQDGHIKLGDGCTIVATKDWEQLKEALDYVLTAFQTLSNLIDDSTALEIIDDAANKAGAELGKYRSGHTERKERS